MLMEIIKLLNNRLGQKIFSYYLVHENEEFYLRELATILKEDPSNLSKFFQKAVAQAIFLEETKKGKEKYFRLNKKHPLFEEIKSLLKKTLGFESRLAREIRNVGKLDQAFIYGSFAKGDLSSVSDIDLFLVGQIEENNLLLKINRLEKEFGREINYIFFTKGEFKKKLKTDSFLKAIIEGPKINLL